MPVLPLFVYGTLRRGHDNEFARLLHGASEFVCGGRVRGKLYQIAHYPGWVEVPDSSDSWVTGELWSPRNAEQLLQRLDEYEGTEYQRVARTIETPGGPVECWVYLYVAPVTGKSLVTSGDWTAR